MDVNRSIPAVSPRLFAAASAPQPGIAGSVGAGPLGQSGASGGDVMDLRGQLAQPVEQASGEPNHDSVIGPRCCPTLVLHTNDATMMTANRRSATSDIVTLTP